MKKSAYWLMVITAAIMALGCGGSRKKTMKERLLEEGEDDPDIISDLTGIDDNTQVKDEPEDMHQEVAEQPSDTAKSPSETGGDAVASNRGAFLATIKIAGKEADGTYTVKLPTSEGTVVKENLRTGQQIDLNPGVYDFVFVTNDVVGNPEMTLRDVELPPGRLIRREVKIPTGQITLVTGKRCTKKKIRIRPKGATDWYPGKFFTCVPMILKAGEYEAEIVAGKRSTPISGIQVYDGGIRDILIRPQ